MLISLGPKNALAIMNSKVVHDGKLPAKAKEAFFKFLMKVRSPLHQLFDYES